MSPMRSHDELLRSNPPSTACSASTECGGSRSDSICASPENAPGRPKRSGAGGMVSLSLWLGGGAAGAPPWNAPQRRRVCHPPLCIAKDNAVDNLWVDGGKDGIACAEDATCSRRPTSTSAKHRLRSSVRTPSIHLHGPIARRLL